MRVRFLRETGSYPAGAIAEVDDHAADALIRCGAAEPAPAPPPAAEEED